MAPTDPGHRKARTRLPTDAGRLETEEDTAFCGCADERDAAGEPRIVACRQYRNRRGPRR
jgi:hypothetical protein